MEERRGSNLQTLCVNKRCIDYPGGNITKLTLCIIQDTSKTTGRGCGASVLPSPQAEEVMGGSKYAESVTDWKHAVIFVSSTP